MNRILLLIRNKRNRQLLEAGLEKNYEIVYSTEPERSLQDNFDLVILDGPTLKHFRTQVRDRREAEEPVLLPFLLLTIRRKGSISLRFLGRLVDDVIVKPINRDELLARVRNLMHRRELSLGLKKEHDRVAKLSVTDDVSGFHNTRYLHRYLEKFFTSPKVSEKKLSLVFFDIDNFKEVVDSHGHLLGSKALREIAQTVNRVLDDDDRIVRYGGDEYVVILPGQGNNDAHAKAERMRKAINSGVFLQKENSGVRVTASFGLATFPENVKNKEELLAAADESLFASKRGGKNRITVTK